VQSIETPRIFTDRHDTTTLGVLRRCATALICMAGIALLFWSIGSLLGIGSGGYGGAGCTGKQHVYHRSALALTAPCALSSDVVATPLPVLGEVPVTAAPVGPITTPDSVSAVVPSTTPVAVPAAIADPRLATSQGRLDYLNTRFRGLVMGLDVVALLVFGAGALVFTLIPMAFTWVRWGGMRVAWSPDLTPVLTPRSRVWFAWFCLAAAAAGEGVRLTSLSEKLVNDGYILAVASGVVASWLLLTVVIGFLNGLNVIFGEARTAFR
jgi:hypothetical protein